MTLRSGHETLLSTAVTSLIVVLVTAAGCGRSEKPAKTAGTGASPGTNETPMPVADLPAVAIPKSEFQNTSPDAHYTGSASCRTCHSGEAATYDLTFHSRALTKSLTSKLASATVLHQKSGAEYATRTEPDALVHTERLLDGTCDPRSFAIDWVVGSGQFGHSFLTKTDDFLIQSPLTWYTTRDCWDMSPGYDQPDHHGFRRAVSARCLYCHAGQTEHRDGNEYAVSVVEPEIGCERCHGPGSLHVDRRTAASDSATDSFAGASESLQDLTIVNPARLSRELQESVCEQCHLQGDTQVLVRGRQFDDFRPGLPLHLFRQEFRASAETGMTVVGHVEQMRASKCYAGTETLTCTTCHHPHQQADREQQQTLYRQACLNCHQPETCRETDAPRQAVADRCTDCHMPKAPTEVPHVAFTHHRIGIHGSEEKKADSDLTGATQIVPLTAERGLSEADLRRDHGLAWLHTVLTGAASNPNDALKQARDDLQNAWDHGARDAAVANGLAQIAHEIGWDDKTAEWSREVLRLDTAPTDERASALATLSEMQFRQGLEAEALLGFEELTRTRRDARHWMFRGMIEQNLGRSDDAIRSLEMSLQINPFNPGAHAALSAVFQSQREPDRADIHRKAAETQVNSARQRENAM